MARIELYTYIVYFQFDPQQKNLTTDIYEYPQIFIKIFYKFLKLNLNKITKKCKIKYKLN